MSQKRAGDLALTDWLIINGVDYQILALNRHDLHDDHLTVTIWTGPLTHAREHVYALTDLVEVEHRAAQQPKEQNEASKAYQVQIENALEEQYGYGKFVKPKEARDAN